MANDDAAAAAGDDYYGNNGDNSSNGDDFYARFGGKDERMCRVYDNNDFFTVLVQLILAAAALGSLYIKRMQEVPRRTFVTWLRDVSKQGVGACYAHVCNMAIAAILSQQLDGETSLEDECAWYGMSYLIDTTLGLVLAIMFLRVQDWLAVKYNLEGLKHNGVYHGPDACGHWTQQTLSWVVILTLVKILIYYFMVIFSDLLAFFGSILFAPFQINIRFELLFVMIMFPGFLNVIYFWIADHYLKAAAVHSDAFEPSVKSDKEEALISEEDKKMQAAESERSIQLTPSQQHQQEVLSHTDWGKHSEFIASYLPAWSVFGVQAKPSQEEEEEGAQAAGGQAASKPTDSTMV